MMLASCRRDGVSALLDLKKLLKADMLGRESHIAHLAKMQVDGVLADRWAAVIGPASRQLSADEQALMYHWFEVWGTERWKD